MMPSSLRRVTGRVLSLLVLVPANGAGQEIKVTLLGTGAPPPVMHRFGPSTLVEAGGRTFLFDTGRGALQRLAQVGVHWQDVDGVFLTHLHSDHVVGFPDLWLTGWFVPPARSRPLRVRGPSGTMKMMAHLEQAYEVDIRIRLAAAVAPSDGLTLLAEDIHAGVVYDSGGVKVTAFDVDHGPATPAFGYRVDYGGRSVVLSGDTRVSENLIRYAQGVDLLVHEVIVPETLARAGVPPERARAVIGLHVTPEQAGQIFARTRPRLAVYSHIVLPGATEQDLIPPTRRTYQGPVEAGEDLMVIEVGERIEVRRPARSSP